MCLVTYIFSKLEQSVCLINTQILIRRQATNAYSIYLGFEKFQYLKRYTFIKLSQIVYMVIKHNYNMSYVIVCYETQKSGDKKVILCNHSWLRQSSFMYEEK